MQKPGHMKLTCPDRGDIPKKPRKESKCSLANQFWVSLATLLCYSFDGFLQTDKCKVLAFFKTTCGFVFKMLLVSPPAICVHMEFTEELFFCRVRGGSGSSGQGAGALKKSIRSLEV
jgi:hypothetical protein